MLFSFQISKVDGNGSYLARNSKLSEVNLKLKTIGFSFLLAYDVPPFFCMCLIISCCKIVAVPDDTTLKSLSNLEKDSELEDDSSLPMPDMSPEAVTEFMSQVTNLVKWVFQFLPFEIYI